MRLITWLPPSHITSLSVQNLQPAVTKAAEELKQKQEASLQGRPSLPLLWRQHLSVYMAVMEAALASISDCETMREVEGVWQGVESQLDHRLKLIEEMGKQLLAVEDLRCEQVSEQYIHHRCTLSHMSRRHVNVCAVTLASWGVWPTAMPESLLV